METWRIYFTLGVLFLILGLTVFFVGLFVNSDSLILIGGVTIALAIACFVLSVYTLVCTVALIIKSFLKEHYKGSQEYPYIA